jgi:hypothetical protein
MHALLPSPNCRGTNRALADVYDADDARSTKSIGRKTGQGAVLRPMDLVNGRSSFCVSRSIVEK